MADDPSEQNQTDIAREEVRRLLDEARPDGALARLSALHVADQAEVIGQLDEEALGLLVPRIPQEALAGILDYLREEPLRTVVAAIDPAVLGPLLDGVASDVAVDILHTLPAARAAAVLSQMATAAEVEPLLPHPDETAGGRMTSDFVALHKQWTVDQALSYLRRTRPDAEQAYYLYVVDDTHRLEGVVSLRNLIVGSPEERIGDLMTPEVVSASVDEDQEALARLIQRYNFVALPVVDGEGRLVGVASVDDLMDVAEEEATEDMYRMAGLDEEESVMRPVSQSLVPRLAWLLVALVSAAAAAAVVKGFEDTIDRLAVLAVFMPVIAGLGGNAGIQTITLVVRSLALGKVELRDVRQVLVRELTLGVLNGAVIGVLVGLLAFLLTGNEGLAAIAGVAMLLNMATAVTAGVLVPISLRAMRLDPALASGVLVTTSTDVLGFFFFLGLATLLLERIA